MINLTLLHSMHLFKGLSQVTLTSIAEHSQIRYYKKGTLLFAGGERLQHFYYVLQGWAKVFRETYDGDEIIIDMFDTLTNTHYFGEAGIFDQIIEDKLETITDAQILVIPMKSFKIAVETDHRLALNLLQDTINHQFQQETEIEHLAIQSAAQRIGCFLLKLYNTQIDGQNVIHLPFQKSLLATRLNMRPETFSRALAKLCQHTGVATLKNNSFVLPSTETLKNFACYRCSHRYPCIRQVNH